MSVSYGGKTVIQQGSFLIEVGQTVTDSQAHTIVIDIDETMSARSIQSSLMGSAYRFTIAGLQPGDEYVTRINGGSAAGSFLGKMSAKRLAELASGTVYRVEYVLYPA